MVIPPIQGLAGVNNTLSPQVFVSQATVPASPCRWWRRPRTSLHAPDPPVALPSVPAIQSAVSRNRAACGRLRRRNNGLHGFDPNGLANFPPQFQNNDVYVINPATGQTWSSPGIQRVARLGDTPLSRRTRSSPRGGTTSTPSAAIRLTSRLGTSRLTTPSRDQRQRPDQRGRQRTSAIRTRSGRSRPPSSRSPAARWRRSATDLPGLRPGLPGGLQRQHRRLRPDLQRRGAELPDRPEAREPGHPQLPGPARSGQLPPSRVQPRPGVRPNGQQRLTAFGGVFTPTGNGYRFPIIGRGTGRPTSITTISSTSASTPPRISRF